MSTTTEDIKAAMTATRRDIDAALAAGDVSLTRALTAVLDAQTREFEAVTGAGIAERQRQSVREAYEARRRSTMPTKNDLFKKAIADLDLFVADASDGHYPADYVARRKADLMIAARLADEEAIREHNQTRAAKLKEARDLRAEAEARRDPQQRIADEMERARLHIEKPDPNDLIAKAEQMLVAGQPERARFLLDTARALGGRPAHRVDRAIEDALDTTIPQRSKARSLEIDAQVEADAFLIDRYDALVRSGVGVKEDGSFGSGQASEVASAQVLKNAFAFRQQQAAKAAEGTAA